MVAGDHADRGLNMDRPTAIIQANNRRGIGIATSIHVPIPIVRQNMTLPPKENPPEEPFPFPGRSGLARV